MMVPRTRLRLRRGGGRVVWGGDALCVCVALAMPLCTRSPSSQGDASVPTPLRATPAPTNVTICPQKTWPGRRKRPHPAPQHPRPYEYEAASEGISQQTSPCKPPSTG